MQGNYSENNEFPKKLERIKAAFRKHDQELEKISKDAFSSGFFEGIVSAFSFWPKEKPPIGIHDEDLNRAFSRLSNTLAKELGTRDEEVCQAWQEVGSYLRTSMENEDVRRTEQQGSFTEKLARDQNGNRNSSNVA